MYNSYTFTFTTKGSTSSNPFLGFDAPSLFLFLTFLIPLILVIIILQMKDRCPKCRAPIKRRSEACPKCGHALIERPVSQPSPQPQQSSPSPTVAEPSRPQPEPAVVSAMETQPPHQPPLPTPPPPIKDEPLRPSHEPPGPPEPAAPTAPAVIERGGTDLFSERKERIQKIRERRLAHGKR